MVTRDELTDLGELGPPATPDEIARAEAALGVMLPRDYANFLECANGLDGDWYWLYSTDELLLENRRAEDGFEPGTRLMCVGHDDGGGKVYLELRADDPDTVAVYYQSRWFNDDYMLIADSVGEWLEGIKLASGLYIY
jgi:hypothetical protein